MDLFTALYLKMMIIFSQLRILEAGGPDNKGTEYIIGYMENKGTDYSADLYVTTMKTTTVTVNVKAPLYTNITIDEQFSITGGQVHKLSFDTRIRAVGDSLEDKGIWITADQEVVIYGVNPEKFSNEAFLGLPTDILGMDYYIITWYPPTEKCQLLIVGVTDSTTVTITLGEALDTYTVTWSGTNYTKGDSIIVNINRFQTLQLTSVGDLTGTQITSDKIIAVFSGNEKTKVGAGSSRDHLVEQWPPVSTLGKNFATVPMPGRTVGDLFKFVATEDNTQINVTGANYSASFTISLAGSHHQLDIPSGNDYYCYVQSDKPILMAQFCKSQESSDEKSDPSMVMIPPIELYSADYTFSTPEYSDIGNYTNYFMFVAKDADKSGLLLDGGPFPGTVEYNPIPGTDLVGGHVEVSHGTHTVRHTSVISVFGGYVFGTANFETYAFVSGSRLAPINTVCVPTTTVIGDLYDNDCDGLIDEELCPNLADEDGDGSVDEDCAMPFPVDGNWTDWTAWSECSVTCSADGSLVSGFTERTRNCSNPAPQYDGRQCEGHENETNTCSTSSYCPVDGNWTDWSAWSSCSVTCKKDENEANGTIIRTRNCSEPVPQYGGNECVGEGNETLICSTTFYCPVHGNWTDWSSWSICSVKCSSNGGEESGTSLRSRSCNDPAPQYNGTDCDGNSTESTSCSTSTECPKDTSGLSLALIALITTLGLLALLATCCCCWLLCALRKRRKRKKKVKPKFIQALNRFQTGYIVYISGYDDSKGFFARQFHNAEQNKEPITNTNNAVGYSGIGNNLYFRKNLKSTDSRVVKSRDYRNDHASTIPKKYGSTLKPESSFHTGNRLNSNTIRQPLNSLQASYSEPYNTTTTLLKPGNMKDPEMFKPVYSKTGKTKTPSPKICKSVVNLKTVPNGVGQTTREISSVSDATASVPRLHKTGYSKGSYYKTKISEPKHHKPRDFVPILSTSF